MLRWSVLLLLTLSLAAPLTARADDLLDRSQPVEDTSAPATPSGPVLQPSDSAPVVCDPAATRFRFLEIRGSGFDAWATQRLVGNLVDASGAPRAQWNSVWVTPRGRLTLEVNLCQDPFRGRPALAAGDYTVSVGSSAGAAIAATSVSLVAPAETGGEDAQAPDVEGAPNTNLGGPAAGAPRAGPGSREQPLPVGTSGKLTDGWQFAVTSVDPDAFSTIKHAIPSAARPADGQQYVLIGVQAIYVGQGSGVLSAVRLGLLGKSGQTYDQVKNGCGIVPDTLPATLIPPGGGLAGNICFAVPSADVSGAMLLFDSQASATDRLHFALAP